MRSIVELEPKKTASPAPTTSHIYLPWSKAISLSGTRNSPRFSVGGTTASMASSFSVGSGVPGAATGKCTVREYRATTRYTFCCKNSDLESWPSDGQRKNDVQLYRSNYGRRLPLGEGWHSSGNAVRLWNFSRFTRRPCSHAMPERQHTP
jgi:hypothetical protein